MFFSVQFDTDNWWTIGGDSYSFSYVSVTHILTVSSSDWGFKIQGVYKLSEDFAKLYFHKYWTEIHDVTTIWKRNVCSFIVTLNAFDVCPTCDTAHVQAILPFPPNPLKHVLCDMSHVGRTSNAFKVTMKLQTFLFQMVVTSCISVQYLWKYGFANPLIIYTHRVVTCYGMGLSLCMAPNLEDQYCITGFAALGMCFIWLLHWGLCSMMTCW